MPNLNDQLQAKCDRLAELKGQIETTLAAVKDRPLSTEEASTCDAADAEIDKLSADIAGIKRQKQLAAKMERLGGELTTVNPPSHSLDDPGKDLAKAKRKTKKRAA